MRLSLFILLLVCSIVGCSTGVDNETVLIIGKYKLTEAELELKKKEDRYQSLTDQDFQERLIQEGRILAFALDHKYDTLPALKTLFKYASRSYAAQLDGFVWNKTVKPKLKLTDQDIKNAYIKRSRVHLLKVLLFKDKSVLDCYYKPSDNPSSVTTKTFSDPGVKTFDATVKYPFYPLSYYIQNLTELKVGELIGPVETENGYLIARVVATKSVFQNSYEQEKAGIQQDLLFGLTQKYMWENQKRILADANPQFYDTVVKELASKFNIRKKDWSGVKPNLPIMNYNFEGKRASYQVSDFREFLANEPVVVGSLNDPNGLKKILRSAIIEQYMFAEAKRMNMENDYDYQRFRKDNQEKIFLEHYRRNYIYPKLAVHTSESEDFYNKNKRNFKTFQSARITLFKFNSMRNAFQGRTQLIKSMSSNAPGLGQSPDSGKILLPKAIGMEVNMNDQNIDPKLLETILRLAPRQVSSPLKMKGEFVVMILTSKEGLTTMPYIYVKDNIQRLIYSQKEKQLTAELAKILKVEYPVDKNNLVEHLSGTKSNSE